jgi:chromate transporter
MSAKLLEIVFAFLKLGFTAFGGPAAAYGMMRQAFVSRRKWLTEEEFFPSACWYPLRY